MFKKIICLFALLTTISMLLVANVSKKETNNTIKNELKVKRKQVVNDDGSITITITYQVLPEEATDKSVTLSLSWSDSSVNDDVNDYLLLEHDASNFEVAITMIKRASNQAMLTITSNSNPEVTSVVLIDFEQEEQDPSELTDLTNTTWLLNKTLDFSGFNNNTMKFHVNFTSNNENFVQIKSAYLLITNFQYYRVADSNDSRITIYASSSGWYLDGKTGSNSVSTEAYRTITITGGTDVTNPDLIAWLQGNATLQ